MTKQPPQHALFVPSPESSSVWKLFIHTALSLLHPSSIFSLRNSAHTATEWKGVPDACFYHSISLLKAAFTYMRLTEAAPVTQKLQLA